MLNPKHSLLRRALPLMLASLLVLAGAAAPATAVTQPAVGPVVTALKTDVKVGDFTYDLDTVELTATVTGWSGNRKTTITIPATIKAGTKTYKVTEIGYGAFAGPVTYVLPDRSPVPATKAVIPYGVKWINSYAFYGNRISSFSIPGSVEWIGTRALDQDEFEHSGWLRKVTFRGDAPSMSELGDYICSPGGCGYNGRAPLGIGNGLIVYYKSGAKGFTTPIWAGYLTALEGSKAVPTGYGTRVLDMQVEVSASPVSGAKLTASLRAWAVGGKLSPKPTKLSYQWHIRQDDGTWKKIGSGKTATIPEGSGGKILRVLTIAKGPGTREAVLQLGGVYTVLKTFTTKPKPTVTLPDGVTKAKVGTKLTATGASAKSWAPDADSVSYRWYRNGKAITTKGGSRSYVVTSADLGKKLTVRVVATKADYAKSARTSVAFTVPKK
ncbi:leucine-rich repeat domain-containing protein [Microbacterium fluvii]|uniref:Leucine-rich repeat domain-containing protein n=1 Tax=Microbacterium fluvii TaxID=415215 RepID=A0ABW2HAR8_9MICO|nr:leucine-rich repeat domain-containing protein [Microbacterium fluvii]MCU4671182.1 leucine-rich repeat domain-containing protein [Microbacterium fluvii]